VTGLPLSCTVRGCALPLVREGRAFTCASGHAYDVARSGYVNVLQPQDRRSLASGDTKAAVEARARLLAAGVGRATLDAVVTRVAALDLPDSAVVVELGSGSGEAIAALDARLVRIGIDLSSAAVTHAARRYPDVTWVIANADRRLPLLDASVHVLLSIHARRNPVECARVLAPGGRLLVALPAPDDLLELRASVLGQAVEQDRTAAVIAEHAASFELEARWSVRERRLLGPEMLGDLLRGTYRGERASAASRVAALPALAVTIASDLLEFQRRT
jgi:23S rRNA (guanine745-N1)-methyltransferase